MSSLMFVQFSLCSTKQKDLIIRDNWGNCLLVFYGQRTVRARENYLLLTSKVENPYRFFASRLFIFLAIWCFPLYATKQFWS